VNTENISRLQLGVSNPKLLPASAIKVFADGTWINLGEKSNIPPRRSLRAILWDGLAKVRRKLNPALRNLDQAREDDWRETYKAMRLTPFWWGKGESLPFRDGAFNFIFSEHFFEHIFMDEAYELFLECKRVLNPKGVFRMSVPDADLRTYAGLEPLAFDAKTGKSSKLGWDHPDTHKTRWNIYSLSLLLKLAGFQVIPLAYCDRYGKFYSEWPKAFSSPYPESSDWKVICADRYIKRKFSLIVNAIHLK